MNIIDHLIQVALLGATWVLYLLFALSIAAFGAMLERWLFFRRNQRSANALVVRLEPALAANDEEAIEDALGLGRSLESKVLSRAFAFRDGGPGAFADAVDAGLSRARADLDRGTTLLGTIGNNAPFIGLFGTVLGVIEAFSYLSAGEEAMAHVMAGIAEALVATAVGIFVAIPSVVGFNVAQKKSGDVETRVMTLAKDLSAWLRVRDALARRPSYGHDDHEDFAVTHSNGVAVPHPLSAGVD